MDTELQLADGTDTGAQELNKKPVSAKFKFQHGNYDLFTSIPNIVAQVRQPLAVRFRPLRQARSLKS